MKKNDKGGNGSYKLLLYIFIIFCQNDTVSLIDEMVDEGVVFISICFLNIGAFHEVNVEDEAGEDGEEGEH